MTNHTVHLRAKSPFLIHPDFEGEEEEKKRGKEGEKNEEKQTTVVSGAVISKIF
jgi:hypothetical protein